MISLKKNPKICLFFLSLEWPNPLRDTSNILSPNSRIQPSRDIERRRNSFVGARSERVVTGYVANWPI